MYENVSEILISRYGHGSSAYSLLWWSECQVDALCLNFKLMKNENENENESDVGSKLTKK